MVPDEPTPELPALRARLERAAAGLLFHSEGDHPLSFFHLAGAGDRPAAALRAHVGLPPDARVEEVALDDFLAGHVADADPADAVAQRERPRWEALRDVLTAAFPDARVWRVGEVDVHCYMGGRTSDGALAGLETVAVET